MPARVAVVGAGVMGLAAARELARRGAEVDVYEQFQVGHVRGSSHGSARIFRLAYPDARWVRLAAESYELWRAIEREYGSPLLELRGLLDVGPHVPDVLRVFAADGVEHERIGAEHARARFGYALPEGAEAVYQPVAGLIHADRALFAFRDGALAAGARLHENAPVARLEEVAADAVVVTAGPWAKALLAPAGVELDATPTRETTVFFPPARAERAPAIIEDCGPELGKQAYALPTPDGLFKVGMHKSGPPTDPDEAGAVDARVVDAAARWVAARFGGDPPVPVRVETCLYTNAPGDEFCLERDGRYVVGSACSGHGFKFAPAIGVRLAALALGDGGAYAGLVPATGGGSTT